MKASGIAALEHNPPYEIERVFLQGKQATNEGRLAHRRNPTGRIQNAGHRYGSSSLPRRTRDPPAQLSITQTQQMSSSGRMLRLSRQPRGPKPWATDAAARLKSEI
jgi:hypothetical protein